MKIIYLRTMQVLLLSVLLFVILLSCNTNEIEHTDSATSNTTETDVDFLEDIAIEGITQQGWALLPGEEELVEIDYEESDEGMIFQGDIILDSVFDEQLDFGSNSLFEVQGASKSNFSRRLWPDGVIPYEIEEGLPTQRIIEAVNHWNDNTVITLIPRTDETDYVFFKRGHLAGVCTSHVGRSGGRQPIKFPVVGNCGTAVLIHEIGHAVGLNHEQSRKDRDLYVNVIRENVSPGNDSIFQKYGLPLGEYDYRSIMHYGHRAGGKIVGGDRLITMESIPAGSPIGRGASLTEKDIATVAMMYDTTTVSLQPTGDAFLLKSFVDKCIGIAPNSTNSGTIGQYECSTVANNKYKRANVNGGFVLINQANQQCLAIKDINFQATNVTQETCTGKSGQILNARNNTFVFTHSNKCLEIVGNLQANGSTLAQRECSGANSQKFRTVVADDEPVSIPPTTPTTPTLGNLLKNVSFESNLSNWSLCDTGRVNRVNGGTKGSKAVALQKQGGNPACLYQEVTVVAGKSYEFSCDTKRVFSDAWSSMSLKFSNQNYTRDYPGRTEEIVNVNYGQTAMSAVAPVGGTRAVAVLYSEDKILADNCSLAVSSGETDDSTNTSNVLQNGGFENDQRGWTQCSEANDSVTIISNGNAYAGSSAVRINNKGCLYQQVVAAPGTDLTLSCQAKNNSSGYAGMTLSYLNANFGTLKEKELEVNGTDYSQRSISLANAPNNTKYAVVTLYSEGHAFYDACVLK